MGTDIASGRQVPTNEVPVMPLDPSATPGVQAPTQIFPSGTEQGSVRDIWGQFHEQDVAGTAVVAAAQQAGQDARGGLLDHYEAHATNAGHGEIGDILALPPTGMDPGVGSLGTTDPSGAAYDPPRSGSPADHE